MVVSGGTDDILHLLCFTVTGHCVSGITVQGVMLVPHGTVPLLLLLLLWAPAGGGRGHWGWAVCGRGS